MHLDRVIELEPGSSMPTSRRRASIKEVGRLDLATADVEAGLAVEPNHAELLCCRRPRPRRGRREGGRAALDAAIETDPTLTAAWANRAVLAFQSGDPQAAVDDLSRHSPWTTDRPPHQPGDHLRIAGSVRRRARRLRGALRDDDVIAMIPPRRAGNAASRRSQRPTTRLVRQSRR